MSDIPNKPHQPDDNRNEPELDELPLPPLKPNPFIRRPEPRIEENNDPIEEFWAAFAMITHTGERFVVNVCFRNKAHYNAEMHKFETAKNIHIVLKDINGESVVIKRDMLLHVLPDGVDEETDDKKSW